LFCFVSGKIIVNTTISACFSSLGTLVISKLVYKKYSLVETVNGALSGMVAICAGAIIVEPWAAMVIGLLAACFYVLFSTLIVRLQIDDPLDSIPVHLGSGIWGIIAAPLFASAEEMRGVFYAGNFRLLGINLAGGVTILLWTLVLSVLIFVPMKHAGVLRISEELEIQGSDERKHKEPAYPYAQHSGEESHTPTRKSTSKNESFQGGR